MFVYRPNILNLSFAIVKQKHKIDFGCDKAIYPYFVWDVFVRSPALPLKNSALLRRRRLSTIAFTSTNPSKGNFE